MVANFWSDDRAKPSGRSYIMPNIPSSGAFSTCPVAIRFFQQRERERDECEGGLKEGLSRSAKYYTPEPRIAPVAITFRLWLSCDGFDLPPLAVWRLQKLAVVAEQQTTIRTLELAAAVAVEEAGTAAEFDTEVVAHCMEAVVVGRKDLDGFREDSDSPTLAQLTTPCQREPKYPTSALDEAWPAVAEEAEAVVAVAAIPRTIPGAVVVAVDVGEAECDPLGRC